LVSWLANKGGTIKQRSDHKLAVVRDMTVPQRVKLARELVENLNRIAVQAKAA